MGEGEGMKRNRPGMSAKHGHSTYKKFLPLAILFAFIFTSATCPPKPPPEKVWVNVCNSFPDIPATEARVANKYCPSHPAQYVKGTEPVVICVLHVKPEPPIPQCDIPCWLTHQYLIYDACLLGWPSSVNNEEFTIEDETAYADAITEDGINCIRGFGFFLDDVYKDGKPYWISWKPVDEEYQSVFQRRLKLMADRKITTIVSLWAYGGGSTDSEIDYIVDLARPFMPLVIFEMQNESSSMSEQRRLIARCKAKGIPNSALLINFNDSGDFADCLQNELNGEGLACGHGVGSMQTIDAPWPNGWSTSSGTLALMKYGLFPSSDGEDAAHSAQGLYWFWLPPPGPGRRPSVDQIYEITKWSLQNGRGYEQLSAAAFQSGGRPNLKAAIELGREERLAMRRAYNEVIH